MSVMACNRRDCPNILCDRLSPNYGYICNECFSALRDRAGEITISDFMDESYRTPVSAEYFTAVKEIEREFALT